MSEFLREMNRKRRDEKMARMEAALREILECKACLYCANLANDALGDAE